MFKAAEPVEITAQHIPLKVPNDIYRYWIEDNYIGSLRAAILLAVKGSPEVRFVCAGAAGMPKPAVRREPVAAGGARGTSGGPAEGWEPAIRCSTFPAARRLSSG